jgi:glycosyltransferase involved in cell wall biosynthesis
MRIPKVSVLIPSYNAAKFLPEALESVLAQDFEDYELLILDDASSDNTRDLLEKYAAIDDRVQIQVHPQRLGMVSNWNECLNRARGEYVKFVFCDDKLSHPGALRAFVGSLDANESVVLAASARSIIDEDSRAICLFDHLGPTGVYKGSDVIIRCLETPQNLIGEPTAVIFRRRDGFRGFNPRYKQFVDLEMWFFLLERGDLAYITTPLCSFRRHSRQQTEQNRISGVGDEEQLTIFVDWLEKNEALPVYQRKWRKLAFNQLYAARKNPARNAESREIEQLVEARLGKMWYAIYWILRKVTVPFRNLRYSVKKRCLYYMSAKQSQAHGGDAGQRFIWSFVSTKTVSSQKGSKTGRHVL